MKDNHLVSLFESYKSIKDFLVIILTIFYFYFFFYLFFQEHNLNYYYFDRILLFFSKLGIFSNHYLIPSFIFFVTSVFSLAEKGNKKKEVTKDQAITYSTIGAVFFISNIIFIDYIESFILFGLTYSLSLLCYMRGLSLFRRLFNRNILKDRFNKRNKIFPQETRLIENDMSVNIPFKFVSDYKEVEKKMTPVFTQGFINLIAPARSTIIIGKPGSGKSYSFNEEFLKQHIKKGFAFINYDFKFPTLSTIAYNYIDVYGSIYEKMYGKPVVFGTICIDDPRYSSRCNCISNKIITKISDAEDAVMTIFKNLDKKNADKEDFFKLSAMSITKAVLWFLKIYKDGKYLSLPHLIEFIQNKDDEILPILADYPELFYSVSAFSDALEKEAYDQLSGQTASARIPLGKLATPELFYVATDPDNTGIDLQVNKRNNVTFLNIANHPRTQQTNSPALGLYLSQVAKLINVHTDDVEGGTVPCNYHIDELPTTFINNLKELIATARSNNICPTLAFQDYSQLVLEYGKEAADNIFNTVDNILSGKVAIDTAEKISKMAGNAQFEQQSVSISKEGSKTFNTTSQAIIPASDIASFSQGEFTGIVSDTFKQQIVLKVFRGFISLDKSDQTKKKLPMINPNLTQEDLKDNMKSIQEDIKGIIKEELLRINLKKQKENEAEEHDQEIITLEEEIFPPTELEMEQIVSLIEKTTIEIKNDSEQANQDLNDFNFIEQERKEHLNNVNLAISKLELEDTEEDLEQEQEEDSNE
ncbi:TraM recognition domain-containing protein [Tenacibaculum finnmarkense]|uniref:TraM recognition domain-containing protein n=1 Tax=Tenacibaculum finnmarkense TaxID=2781243 RepID=UPI00187B74A9|nr:TraM recognition domain-containing protein [Tenacibaculum finnmarkense]MBE7649026.1 TraM recognition domain-containing protein [Tenacibaculum finnmarkense genomovar ulcerans]